MDDKDIILPAGSEHDVDTITINGSSIDTIDISSIPTIDLSTLNMASSNYTYSTLGATGSNGSFAWTTSPSTYYSIGSMGAGGQGLHVKADAEFEGDVKIKGKSVVKLLEKIEDRLALLQDPDPKKLEKFAALKKAYDNYKLLEKLIGDDAEDPTTK